MRTTKGTARPEKQITPPKSEPKLTLKQEAFVNVLFETGNQYEAYCRAYKCEYMSREAIDVEASKFVRHPKIALRLGQFRESKTAEAMLTLEEHMEELKSLRDMAKSAGQLSAAISAEVKRGELRRFYVKQIESAHVNEFSKMSDEELDRFIRESDVLIRSMEPGIPPAVTHNSNGRSKR
jgi:phage terminase small subunit